MQNTANQAVRDAFEIGALLVSVVFVAMLVKNAAGAGQLISTVSTAFGGLLQSATLSDNVATNHFSSQGYLQAA